MEQGLTFEQVAGKLNWQPMGEILLIDVELCIKRSGGNELYASMVVLENHEYFDAATVIEAKKILSDNRLIYNRKNCRWEQDRKRMLSQDGAHWSDNEETELVRVFHKKPIYELSEIFQRSEYALRERYRYIKKRQAAAA